MLEVAKWRSDNCQDCQFILNIKCAVCVISDHKSESEYTLFAKFAWTETGGWNSLFC